MQATSPYLNRPCRSLREVILERVGTPERYTMRERLAPFLADLATLLAYECGSPQAVLSAVTRTTETPQVEARRILAERRANGTLD